MIWNCLIRIFLAVCSSSHQTGSVSVPNSSVTLMLTWYNVVSCIYYCCLSVVISWYFVDVLNRWRIWNYCIQNIPQNLLILVQCRTFRKDLTIIFSSNLACRTNTRNTTSWWINIHASRYCIISTVYKMHALFCMYMVSNMCHLTAALTTQKR